MFFFFASKSAIWECNEYLDFEKKSILVPLREMCLAVSTLGYPPPPPPIFLPARSVTLLQGVALLRGSYWRQLYSGHVRAVMRTNADVLDGVAAITPPPSLLTPHTARPCLAGAISGAEGPQRDQTQPGFVCFPLLLHSSSLPALCWLTQLPERGVPAWPQLLCYKSDSVSI